MDKYIVTQFNEYKQRLQENITSSGKLTISVRLDDGFAFVTVINSSDIGENDIILYKFSKQCEESSALHKSIYLSDDTIRAVIHSDTPYAAAIGKTRITLPAILDDTAQIIGINVRTANNDTASVLRALKGRKGAIIQGNGIVTHGRTLDEACTGCLVLEKAAKCYIAATILGGHKKISCIEAALMHFIYQKKYSKANQLMLQTKPEADSEVVERKDVGLDTKEQTLRQQVVDAGIRLLNSNLVQGTWGNISVRLDDKHMLITPSGLDYLSLRAEDIVKVNIETMKYRGLKPSGERDIHAMLLKARKDIDVVMHSHPNECSAFAASGKELPAESAEMKKYVKGEARVSSYALPSTKGLAKATVRAIKDRNACFMANHGMLAVGKSFDETFDCCRVLEESAGAFIDAKASSYCPNGKTAKERRIKAFMTILGK